MRLLPLVLFAPLLAAQSLTITEEKVYNRPAWVLSNGVIRVAILPGGGHIAEVRYISGDPKKDVNPMRVPHYPTIDPDTFVDSKHNAIYGSDPHRWLSSGYMGHLLCFPFYGPPSSKAEIAAGLGNHGEAPIVRWKELGRKITTTEITFRYGSNLLKTQYSVHRTIRLTKGKPYVTVEETIQNEANFDRPFQWMQHATFGQPFIEPGKTILDASATRGLTANTEFTWPIRTDPDGKPVDLRPMQPQPNSGSYSALLMDPSRKTQFFTLYHPDYKVLIGYTFPTATTPWLADWQENKRSTSPPWNGQVVARGLEFGNSPFAEGLRKAVDRASLFGVPAYEWIGAHEQRKTEFTIFLAEIPPGYKGTRDVTIEGGEPKLVPR